MKLLRNPVVVGILATGALAFVVWNIAGPMMKKSRPSRGPAKTAKVTPAKPAASAAKAAKPPSQAAGNRGSGTGAPVRAEDVAVRPMDLAAIQARIREWIEAPQRDPFERQTAVRARVEGPKAADVLALRAIWRQTGGQFAVINNAVLREGDPVAGYTLERIEGDGVWVSGTNGLERVEFSLVPSRRPAAPGRSSNPSPGGTRASHHAARTP
ncbi:MAG: hypothetical protein KF833_13115 [Verrucomicrobiae bacterium]|nr:hypothetical protein [Verrucomicrobiae bacterium]